MRTVIKEIDDTLRRFVNGRRHKLLIVDCAPENSPLLLKTLEAIEGDPAVPDILLTFGHPFRNGDAYVNQTISSIHEQLSNVNEQLISRGDPPLESLPAGVDDSRRLPESRLFTAIEHIRDVVPRGRQLVWVFYPLEIEATRSALEEYEQIIRHLVTELKTTALRGVKIIVRDSSSHTVIRGLKQIPEVRFYVPPLDPDSIKHRLNQAANDPKIPVQEQAQIHMMLSGIDVSTGNLDQAITRNQELLGYFYHTGQRHHQSVILNNVGDINYLQGRYDQAQQSYEQALLIAAEEQSQPLVTYQSINLGNSLMMQQKYEDALSYYSAAAQLAEANKSLPYQVQALERIGEVHQATGAKALAAESWQKAADLCVRFKYDLGLRPFLDRLMGIYRELNNVESLNACRKALADLVRRQG
ncbi:MAG TPA: tetratricopeptide repeat protein [Blastocatellia bacterium]|nr:tetratricopeptide repeat protein [Blastocatellia bacterium]